MNREFRFIFALFFVIGIFSIINAQSLEKENIAVIPFSGWQGKDAQFYQNSLTERISSKIIKSQRFTVIDRKNLDKVLKEHGLQMSGIIDQKTVVEFGRLSGVHKFITGSFTQNTSEFHKEDYKVFNKETKKEEKKADSYFSADVKVSIKMLDVEKGKYIEAADATGRGTGINKESALSRALDQVAKNVVDAFFKYFAIIAYVESVDKSNITIDRGKTLGIKRMMNFEVLDISKNDKNKSRIISSKTKRIGLVKVVAVEKHSATGRMIGRYDMIKPGYLLREIKEKIVLEASIIKKEGGEVIVNVGDMVGVKKGATFNVIEKGKEYIDPLTGESFGTEEFRKGLIYVYKVSPRFSRAKILKGRFNIKEGMTLKETKGWQATTMYNLAFSVGKVSVAANTSPWKGEIGNSYVVNRIDSVDYSRYEDLKHSELIKFQIGTWDVVRSMSMIWGFGAYKIHDDLSIFIIDFSVYKHFWIVPEYFYIYPGAGLGLGIANQKPKPGLIDYLSNDNDENVSSVGLQFSGTIGARLALGKINIFGEIIYTGLKFDKWEYEVEYKDKDGDKKTKDITIPDYLLPYPEVSVGGPSIRIGIAWIN